MADEPIIPATPPVTPPVPEVKAVVPPVPEVKTDDKKPEGEKTEEARKSLLQKVGEKKEEPKEGEKKPEEKAGDIEIKLAKDAKVDEKVLGEFKALSKEAGLKSEGAQKLFDFYTKAEAAKAAAAKTADNELQDKWEAEIVKWPDAEEKLGLAKKAILALGDEDAQAFFQDSFVGSNPSIIKFLAGVGKLLSEAPVVEGEGRGGNSGQTLEQMFPSMVKKA